MRSGKLANGIVALGLLAVACGLAAVAQAGQGEPCRIFGLVQTADGQPVAGVKVSFSGELVSETTDTDGRYAAVAPGGLRAFSVTPSKAGYAFSPASAMAWVCGSDVEADFTASVAMKAAQGSGPTVIAQAAPWQMSAKLKSVTFTSDHGKVLTDWKDNFKNFLLGHVYSPRGWDADSGKSNPITHSQGKTISANVVVRVSPPGKLFRLEGVNSYSNPNEALHFYKSGVKSTGNYQTVQVSASAKLPSYVDILNESIEWAVFSLDPVYDYRVGMGASGPHEIFVTWNKPMGEGPTYKRIQWACNIAKGCDSITAAAGKFRDQLASDPGYKTAQDNYTDKNQIWAILDVKTGGDCISLAALAARGLEIIGIPSSFQAAYPTADAIPQNTVNGHKFPRLSGNSCRQAATLQFKNPLGFGPTFEAKLMFPQGQNFEGFFTVNDPGIKAYTVYYPKGPFEDPKYYYLQVLQSATSDQYWAWTATHSWGLGSVVKGQPVPFAAHIPVPAIP